MGLDLKKIFDSANGKAEKENAAVGTLYGGE